MLGMRKFHIALHVIAALVILALAGINAVLSVV